MNLSAPDAPQPGARPEGTVMRFLRWLIEPPVKTQPRELLVLRWLLRAVCWVLYAGLIGPGGEAGSGGGEPKRSKPGKPPA